MHRMTPGAELGEHPHADVFGDADVRNVEFQLFDKRHVVGDFRKDILWNAFGGRNDLVLVFGQLRFKCPGTVVLANFAAFDPLLDGALDLNTGRKDVKDVKPMSPEFFQVELGFFGRPG